MSDSLSEQLRRLGIRPAAGAALPSSVEDQIDEIMTSAFPWPISANDWHPTLVAQARDTHETMAAWMLRLEMRLAQHGIKLSHTFETPLAPDGTTYILNGVLHHHHSACEHSVVEVNASVSALYCRACKLPVNPVWWLAKRTAEIEKAENYNRHLRAERARLGKEIEDLKADRKKHRAAAVRARDSAVKAAVEQAAPALRKRRGKKS